MSASYPGSGPKTFTSKATNDTIQAAHVNDLQDEVTAVETALLGTMLHDIKLTTGKKFYEQARTKALGESIAVVFSAGNFVGNGGTPSPGGWTVGSGDQANFMYRLVGDTLWLNIEINTTTVATGPTSLRITIPGSFTAQETQRIRTVIADNGTVVDAIASVTSGNTYFSVARADGAALADATNGTGFFFAIHFKVS